MTTIANQGSQAEGAGSEARVLKRIGPKAEEILEVPLDDIVVLPEIAKLRAKLDEDYIDGLVEILDDTPPISVIREKGKCFLLGGQHRLAAYRQARRATARVVIKNLARGEWASFAIQDNKAHGRPFTTAEKKAATRLLLEQTDDSIPVIAQNCGLSESTVRRIDRERKGIEGGAQQRHLTELGTPAKGTKPRDSGTRRGRDDRNRPTQRGEAQARADAYAQANPEASSREIAREAGTGKGTAEEAKRRLVRVGQTADAKPAPESPEEKTKRLRQAVNAEDISSIPEPEVEDDEPAEEPETQPWASARRPPTPINGAQEDSIKKILKGGEDWLYHAQPQLRYLHDVVAPERYQSQFDDLRTRVLAMIDPLRGEREEH